MPSISSLVPDYGAHDSVIRLQGSGLSTVTSVTFGGVAASFTVISSTKIDVVVPAGVPLGTTTVVATSGSGSGSHSFLMLFPGPWRYPAVQTKTITYTISPSILIQAEGSSEDRAAQGHNDHTDGVYTGLPFLPKDVIGGARYGIGSTTSDNVNGVWHSYSQSALASGWNITDLVDDSDADPDAYAEDYDFTGADTAVSAVDIDFAITPGSIGSVPTEYTDTELRLAMDAFPFVPRTVPEFPAPYSLHELETPPNAHVASSITASREWAAGAGTTTITGLDPTLWNRSGNNYLRYALAYAGVNADLPSTLAAPTSSDPYQFVYWTAMAYAVITFTPVPIRDLYETPPVVAVTGLRARQRMSRSGGAPRSRQIRNAASSLRRGPGAPR